MDAVPLAAAELTVKLGVASPSLVSVNVRVPVMDESSSSPDLEVSPEKEPVSSTWLMDVVRLIDPAVNEVDPPFVETSI